ncbi:MAG TPA: ATP synthase F1 subunit epsilon [Thermoanaerobaculia bacterium]|nr:ATP synthase F1 subunit epsilon [Thermoanaerobaculia bacterium]
MARERTFHLSVVTPEGSVLDTEALSVVFPSYDGEYGILPNHAPLLSLLGIGELRVTRADGTLDRLYLDGGFAQFVDNRLTLVSEQVQPLEHLDPERPAELIERARDMRVSNQAMAAARDAAFERARVQRRLLDRRGPSSAT